MCRKVKTKSVCATCNDRIGERINTQWCRDARRRGTLGRCTSGLRGAEEEFRGEECQKCSAAREAFIDKLEMSECAQKGLGWRTVRGGGRGRMTETLDDDNDEDLGCPYTW
ncbi:uncharacterized protein PG998_005066 [Apiospora kogelbergensis]|uniref:Stc1 domain-containing protein n=1 Tax=Apiospora kogelbergensis TaxID=1337665 RepID=A0AAW0Q9Z2_9PEZI